MTEIRNIKVTIEEKNLIINNGADKLPLNPTSQGFSGQSVRKQLSQAVTGARGSVLALMIEKFSIIEDFSNTVLLVEVKAVGDDLTFIYADGREFKFPLDVITNGLVKFVNDKAPDENGRVVINIDDISELRDFITTTTTELFRIDFEFTKHKNDIDNPHNVTAEQINTYEKDVIDSKVGAKLDKIWTDLTNQSTSLLTDEFVLNRGNSVYKTTLATMLSKVAATEIFVVVQELPETGQINKIYLVISQDSEVQNIYEEFIWAFNEDTEEYVWERIGSANVDLSNYFNKTEINALLGDKVDKVAGMGLSTNDFTNNDKNKLDGIESGAEVNPYSKTQLDDMLDDKVDKVAGMGLSKNDFTDEYKNKVDDTIDDVSQLQTGKQDKLTAGTNITIGENNVISASGGMATVTWQDVENKPELYTKGEIDLMLGDIESALDAILGV